jgi:hypothetical protein
MQPAGRLCAGGADGQLLVRIADGPSPKGPPLLPRRIKADDTSRRLKPAAWRWFAGVTKEQSVWQL